MSVKALRKIQMGDETTAGTAVAATVIWRGQGVLKDDNVPVFPEEDIGYLMPTNRNYFPKDGATLEMEETPATFEQLTYILSSSIENVHTATADGTGSGYIYQYDFPITAANSAPLTYTIEMGDDQRSDEMQYAFVQEFTLSGAGGEAVNVSATWVGRAATDCDFTGSLSPIAVEEILFSKGKLYLDATGGTIGTTQKTSTWLGFELNVPSNWMPVYTADGAVTFTFLKYTGGNPVTGTLILEHDATGEAEVNFAKAGTVRLLRMEWLGTALTTAGTSWTYNTLQASFAIQYTDVPELSDQDGNDVIELPWRQVYSDSQPGQIVVINENATVG
jgi:hypothetical protein